MIFRYVIVAIHVSLYLHDFVIVLTSKDFGRALHEVEQ